jgi:2,3-dihydroxy-p-cumate/2,3-dihydroxybenzoate 3,4-dioxygenase
MAVDFRYRKLGYLALNVTDLERTTDFAVRTFGLDVTEDGPNGERYLRCGMDHHSLVLTQNATPGLVRGAWELESAEDVDRAFSHFTRIGCSPQKLSAEERAALGIGLAEAFRINEPTTGACIEFYAQMLQWSRPLQSHLTEFLSLGHYAIGVPDVREAAKFAVEHMGFVVSDYVGNLFAAFVRAFPNPNHHSFGYLKCPGGRVTFNHVAFMVNSIDDIGKLFNRIERHSVTRAWGIGRHPTSRSIHLYIHDPDGMTWEYTLGMEQFPEHDARPPRQMSAAPEDGDLWGARPQPSMINAQIGVVIEKSAADAGRKLAVG